MVAVLSTIQGEVVKGVSARPDHLEPSRQEVQDPGTQGGVQSQLHQLANSVGDMGVGAGHRGSVTTGMQPEAGSVKRGIRA